MTQNNKPTRRRTLALMLCALATACLLLAAPAIAQPGPEDSNVPQDSAAAVAPLSASEPELVVIDLSTASSRLHLFSSETAPKTFHLKGNGNTQNLKIRLEGTSAPFYGTIILENVNISTSLMAALDFVDGSTAVIRLIGDNTVTSYNHAGININKGNLTIEAFDTGPASLRAIGGGNANGIGAGEGVGNQGDYLAKRPEVCIRGNCTVTAQGGSSNQTAYALGAKKLTMEGSATLILNSVGDPAKGLHTATPLELSRDITIGGNAAAGDLSTQYYSLTLTADPAGSQHCLGSVTLTAELPGAAAGGTLTFYANGDLISSASLPENTAVFGPAPPFNDYLFTVEYSGAGAYGRKLSTPLFYRFTKAPQAALAAEGAAVDFGSTLELLPLVSGGSGTGAVSFRVKSGPGEINGTTLTPTGSGEINLIATKAEDTDYQAQEAEFQILVNPRVISFAVAPVEVQAYTGSAVTPAPEVRDGDLILTANVHFTYSYTNNVNSGASATVLVTGIGGYEGSTGSTTFSISGGGSQDDSKEGDRFSDSHDITILPLLSPHGPTSVRITALAEVKNSAAALAVTDSMIKVALEQALTVAKTRGTAAKGISIDIGVTAVGASSFSLTLEQGTLHRLTDAGVKELHFSGLPVNLSFNQAALEQLTAESGNSSVITIKPAAANGLRNAFDLTLRRVKDGKSVDITSLGPAAATLAISSVPGADEFGSLLYGAFLGEDGQIQRIAPSSYDAASGRVIFATNHFSVYGIGYGFPSDGLTDIGSHWARESIEYTIGRGLLTGTSAATFSPDHEMTRGMLVTALGRLSEAAVAAFDTSSFTDVSSSSYALPYIEWAYQNGIIQGVGNQQFAPDRAVTREEIAVIFANYAKATGYTLPLIREETAYADDTCINYRAAVSAMQQSGMMTGGSGNKFYPKQSATRAEVSAILHRYLRLTTDPATAQGWIRDNKGQYRYYKDGKALTGTQAIDGVTYFFSTDGTMKTGWVLDGANWYYYSGRIRLTGWQDLDGSRYHFNADGSLA